MQDNLCHDCEELSRLRKMIPDADFITCAFCGFKSLKGDSEGLADHLLTCEKHPLTLLLKEMVPKEALNLYVSSLEKILKIAKTANATPEEVENIRGAEELLEFYDEKT